MSKHNIGAMAPIRRPTRKGKAKYCFIGPLGQIALFCKLIWINRTPQIVRFYPKQGNNILLTVYDHFPELLRSA